MSAREVPAFPEFGDIVANLAAVADALSGPDNRHRQGLRDVATAMGDATPRFRDATASTMGALFELIGQGKTVDKPETWLLAAVMTLLSHEMLRLNGGTNTAPAGSRPS